MKVLLVAEHHHGELAPSFAKSINRYTPIKY